MVIYTPIMSFKIWIFALYKMKITKVPLSTFLFQYKQFSFFLQHDFIVDNGDINSNRNVLPIVLVAPTK